MLNFNPTEYKLNSKANWNSVAPNYHHNWANSATGPFRSTAELVKIAQIKQPDKVLDLACGTGAVSKQVVEKLGSGGSLVGIDFSRTALVIAKKFVNSHRANFFEMDAENLGLHCEFDKVLCQYGIMFLPNTIRVFTNIKKLLKPEGRIVLAVHGTAEEVPYFSAIMKPILDRLPEIRPEGAPTVHRFGNPLDLEAELKSSGFTDIVTTSHVFTYKPGTFDQYWNDYMHSTANSIRPKIESLGKGVISSIKEDSQKNVSPYLQEGGIVFPWTVHIIQAQ